jgi:hypothetical protein
MAGELFRVILHFRSNFQNRPDIPTIEKHIESYLSQMAALGHVEHVEVVSLNEVANVRDELDRSTIPVPAPAPNSVPAVIISEPDTGKRTKIPGTGE